MFCGLTDKLTREHLWPEWLRERGILSDHDVEHLQGSEAPADEWERRWKAPDATQTGRIVCKPCNTGWMSRLEGTVANLLEPMMLGIPRTLDIAEQDTIALWAAKMTAVWESINPRVNAVSEAEYRHIHRWRSPPPGWRVWIAAYGGTTWNTYHWKHPLRLLPAETHHADRGPVRAEEVNAHLSTFLCKRYVFQTFGAFTLDVRQPAALHERHFAPYVRSVWPVTAPVRWPPDATLDDDAFTTLCDGALAE
jgi:hypothetical protein